MIMKALIIFNLITNLIIIGFYFYKTTPYYIEVEKTFWEKRPYRIVLWRRTSYGATGVWGFCFRNQQKVEKRDEEYYKKYRKAKI